MYFLKAACVSLASFDTLLLARRSILCCVGVERKQGFGCERRGGEFVRSPGSDQCSDDGMEVAG